MQSSLWLLLLAPSLVLAQAPTQAGQSSGPRRLVPTDIYRIKDVGAPKLSPDGQWVAYTLSTPDSVKDRANTDIHMVSWDGSRRVQLTSSPDGESSPEWSPDNRYLSFLSSRGAENRGAQLWLMDRLGGEGVKVTDIRGGIESYVWAPDGGRLVFVIKDPDPDSTKADEQKPPKAIEIDRWDFKRDYIGYLDRRRTHLYLFDLATRRLTQLTSGDYDDAGPAWSPDGRNIAFTSKRAPGSERTDNWDLYVIEAREGAEPRQLTTTPTNDGRAASYSPDGRWIAFLQRGDPKYWAYNNPRVAVIPSTGGPIRVLTEALDRNASEPTWSHDGKHIYFRFDDDRKTVLARVSPTTGAIERVSDAEQRVSALSVAGDRVALSVTTDTRPAEVVALERGALRRLTAHNDSLMNVIDLGRAERFSSTSKDGTVVGSMLYLPPDYRAGQRYPLALHIHGGPFGQDGHGFDFTRRVMAARGYAVLAVNYRGSSGRGEGFSTAIFADWGNKEVVDLLGAVDQAVASGIADPERLVLGGWSYGGILTNYTIATDTRFKAGVSGAGSSLQLSMYGTDQYVYQYEQELGQPWKNIEPWLKVSYPFLKADRIVTPTMFMGGERDFNVPIIGSEQMYQALMSNNVESRLIVWPGMFHGPRTPGQRIDIINRYLGWWERYVKPAVP
ncbi:MAG: S9 family peptidase [Gemmatimonadales bacterium]|nr:S9 family peptidase [Gemmatimonadales bacterium]